MVNLLPSCVFHLTFQEMFSRLCLYIEWVAFWLNIEFQGESQSKRYLPSVSASLTLAALLGVAETVALSFGSGFLTNLMGIPPVCQPYPFIVSQ